MTFDIARAKDVVETWNFQKVHNRQFNQMDMRKFVELNNDRSRQLILTSDVRTVDEFQRIGMLAGDAASLLTPNVTTEQLMAEGIVDARLAELKTFLSEWQINNADFYIGLMELCVHACTVLTPKARVIADGIDRTNV